jgi:Predicted membrane-bound dolichyl-phosphate-mannose-protein mannosyltransferase
MQNSFAIYINPDVYASGTPAYLVALAYALYKRDDVSALYLSTYGGYWLVYLAATTPSTASTLRTSRRWPTYCWPAYLLNWGDGEAGEWKEALRAVSCLE